MHASDFQLGYAMAMRLNGSLKVPTGTGKTVMECELARKFSRPLFVSVHRIMCEQMKHIAGQLNVQIKVCTLDQFNRVFAEYKPNMIIACESLLKVKKIHDTILNCGVPVWMNRSV